MTPGGGVGMVVLFLYYELCEQIWRGILWIETIATGFETEKVNEQATLGESKSHGTGEDSELTPPPLSESSNQSDDTNSLSSTNVDKDSSGSHKRVRAAKWHIVFIQEKRTRKESGAWLNALPIIIGWSNSLRIALPSVALMFAITVMNKLEFLAGMVLAADRVRADTIDMLLLMKSSAGPSLQSMSLLF